MDEVRQLTKDDIKNSLWVEKYRPPNIAAMALLPEYRVKLQEYIKAGVVPHLLFEGPPGSGKTSIIFILIEALNADALIMNAGDERGIDVVRNKIKNFARNMGGIGKSMKIVFMDEFDAMTIDAQKALNSTIEKYSGSTRFLASCNYISKLDEAILSRFQVFHFNAFPRSEMEQILKTILSKEKIGYTEVDLQQHITRYYPDMRKAINEMQHSVRSGKFVYIDQAELFGKLVEYMQLSKVKDIREALAGRSVDYQEIYRYVYDNIDQFPGPIKATVLLEAAEYLYRGVAIPDPEINFVAFCIKVAAAINTVKK